MRKRSVQLERTIEEEINSLNDLGLSAKEKISILELLSITADPNDRELMQQAIEAIAVESLLLGGEDK